MTTCLTRPFAWGGRAGPSEFWWFTLFYLAFQAAALTWLLLPPGRVAYWWWLAYNDAEARAWAELVRFHPPPFPDLTMPMRVMRVDWMVVLGLSVVPNLAWIAVIIRRLHDTDHRGWWFWLLAIPGVGLPLLLVLLIAPGEIHRNRYGPGRGVPRRGTAAAAKLEGTAVDPLSEIEGAEALRALREARMQA